MRAIATGFVTLGLVALVGCNTSPPGGSVSSRNNASGAPSKVSTAGSFTIGAPTGASNVKQGASETFKVKINKGSEFKEDVELTFTAPAASKLKVEPASAVAKASEAGEVSVTVTADKESPLGKHTIQIAGKPTKGESVNHTFDVEVVKP
jgi:uncharacterized membrane protein